MDSNFFEYLIIIFFIVSALQSIFGKKKRQAEKQNRAGGQGQNNDQQKMQQRQRQQMQNRNRNRGRSPQTLEELFGLKMPEQNRNKEKMTKIPSDTKTEVLDPASHNQTSWNPEDEFKDSLGIETVQYRDTRKEKTKFEEPDAAATMEVINEKLKETEKTINEMAKSVEIVDVDGYESQSNEFIRKLKNTLHNPETLREYILISEILNKPKALRR